MSERGGATLDFFIHHNMLMNPACDDIKSECTMTTCTGVHLNPCKPLIRASRGLCIPLRL